MTPPPALSDYDLGSCKILLIGGPGSGKTCLATTLGPKAVVLDLNNGLASAQTLNDKFQSQRGKCDVKRCWGGGPDLMWKRTVGYINSFAQAPDRPALVIDGLSDLTGASLGQILTMKGKWTDTDPKNATMQEWGIAISQVQRVLWTLRSMDSLVVVVAHTKQVEQDGVTKDTLSCYGKALPGEICAAFDEIWYLKTIGFGDKRKRIIQTQPTGGTDCKTRRQLPDGSDVNLGLEGLLELVGWEWKGEEG